MINFIKRDFRSVHEALKYLTKGKLPTWVIVVYYILVAPIGFTLYPFVKIYYNIKLKRLLKDIEAE